MFNLTSFALKISNIEKRTLVIKKYLLILAETCKVMHEDFLEHAKLVTHLTYN